MRLDEAIKIKEDMLYHRYLHRPEEVEVADKLSIEALKRVKWHKKQHPPGYYELLPGETEDKQGEWG